MTARAVCSAVAPRWCSWDSRSPTHGQCRWRSDDVLGGDLAGTHLLEHGMGGSPSRWADELPACGRPPRGSPSRHAAGRLRAWPLQVILYDGAQTCRPGSWPAGLIAETPVRSPADRRTSARTTCWRCASCRDDCAPIRFPRQFHRGYTTSTFAPPRRCRLPQVRQPRHQLGRKGPAPADRRLRGGVLLSTVQVVFEPSW